MRAIVHRRERVLRVRRVQHLQAAAAAAQAAGRAAQLETTSGRLGELRATLVSAPGATFGAALSGAGELGLRLEKMRDGLTDAIVGARATAAEQAALRLAARIREESAARLRERSATAWNEERERRLSAIGGRRREGKLPE